jgi:oligopeptide transport system substrate-binding protein
MWKDELNIDVTISNQEWKVYLDSVSTMNFDVARRGWIGDYVDPNNFLDLYLTDGGNNNTGFADPVYDDLIQRQAPRATTREERFACSTRPKSASWSRCRSSRSTPTPANT